MSSSNKPSSLGTSDHWSTVYTQELENYRTNKAHRGDVWYGEEAEDDAVDWYCDLWDEYKCKGTTLDIGCGNGSMTVKLAKSGRLGKVTGSDYVQSSVDLTRQVLDDEGLSTVSVYTDDLRSSRWGSGKDGGLLGGVIDKVRSDEGSERSELPDTVMQHANPPHSSLRSSPRSSLHSSQARPSTYHP